MMQFTKDQLSDWRKDVVKRIDIAMPNKPYWTYQEVQRYQSKLYHELMAVDQLKLSLMNWGD